MAALPIHVLGFSGSLRKGSYNTALLHAAGELLPEGMTFETFDLAPIPLYNDDIRTLGGYPEPVQRFRDRISAADALLIVTPEYNFSVPGVLKNAIDWASRPGEKSTPTPLNLKPAAMMGASTGAFGTVRAQMHLRNILVYTNTYVLAQPQTLVMNAPAKFSPDGKLTDEPTRKFVADEMAALLTFARRFKD